MATQTESVFHWVTEEGGLDSQEVKKASLQRSGVASARSCRAYAIRRMSFGFVVDCGASAVRGGSTGSVLMRMTILQFAAFRAFVHDILRITPTPPS